MAKSKKGERELTVQKAAYLCAERGMTQRQIAEFIEVSQSRVSRLLKQAEEKGWLERSYHFVPKGLSPGRVEELRRIAEPKGLVQLLAGLRSDTSVRVRDPHIVESGPGGTSDRAFARRLKGFGRSAGVVLAEFLEASDTFAVTWGRTVSHVIDSLGEATVPRVASRSVRFVPVCGEPLEQASNRDTSSHLVERLHRLLKSTALPPPSLTGVPALIPRSFQGADARGIRRFVAEAASYRVVFGSKSPLINQVDSLLTSVGSADHPMGFIHDELLRAGSTPSKRLTKDVLARLVAGDIGGVLIPRRGLDADGRREVESLNAMWTGVRRSHLERIARQAARSSRPGVIVVSMGSTDRAEVIAEALRCGLVNELIIDRELAVALTRVLSVAG